MNPIRPLVYFLKAGPVAAESPDGAVFPFAYARNVRRLEGELHAKDVRLPVFRWADRRVRATGHPLPARIFSGYAYGMPAPVWFEAAEGVDRGGTACPQAVGLKSRPEFPSFAESGNGLGTSRSTSNHFRRRFFLTPLGRFCRHPEVRIALAQDKLAKTLLPYVQTPDLLVHEDALMRDWEGRRPEEAAEARASAAALEDGDGLFRDDVWSLRRRLRLAALRRLDAAAVGREIFQPCPAFFGEPYIASADEDAGADRSFHLKAGIVSFAQYWPKTETEALSKVWRSDEKLIAAVERGLLPVLPPSEPETSGAFATAAAAWLATAPLREFEARSPLPLFPVRTIYPDGIVPRGFKARIAPETALACGGSYLTLAAAGLSPYIAEPFLEICENHREELAEWAKDPLALAIEKWGSEV